MGKIIVLNVDRDDDLGKKAGIKGPIIGRENCIKAGQALVMADPGESDGNAIFEAVKTFDELKSDAAEVAVLTGHRNRGYDADRMILKQLELLLKKYENIDGVFFVTDGADDDELIPIIQSRIKIVSKKTLIIKQSKELEKSYYVIKEVLKDPHFARIIFGLPAIILLMIGFFQDLGVKIIILGIGAYLLLKGFGIEDRVIGSVRNFRETTSIERASFPIYVGALLTFFLAIWSGYEKLLAAGGETVFLKQAAAFASGFIDLFTISAVLYFVGRIGDMHYREEAIKAKKYMLSIVSIAAMWIVITRTVALIEGKIAVDEFMGFLVIAFIVSIAGLAVVRAIYTSRYITAKLKKDMEVYDAVGHKVGRLLEFSKKTRNTLIETEKGEKMRVPFSKILIVRDKYLAVKT